MKMARGLTFKYKCKGTKAEKPEYVDFYKEKFAKYYNLGGMFGSSLKGILQEIINIHEHDLLLVKADIENDYYYQREIKNLKTNQRCAWWHGLWDSAKWFHNF